jgi:uncharacterized membrane protein YgcG
MIRSERAEADKTEKTKGRPLKGSMVLSNPIVRVPGQRETVVVPLVVVRDRRLGGILATSGEMRREGGKGRDPGGTSEGGDGGGERGGYGVKRCSKVRRE